eukprot:15446995-Alexandrium_andersonii.AAC.1
MELLPDRYWDVSDVNTGTYHRQDCLGTLINEKTDDIVRQRGPPLMSSRAVWRQRFSLSVHLAVAKQPDKPPDDAELFVRWCACPTTWSGCT